MSRSRRKSVIIPQPIADSLEIQRERGVIRYPSENAVNVGMSRYQVFCPGEHLLTSPIAYMGQADQDVIDDFGYALTVKGLRYRTQLMEHLLRTGMYVPSDQSYDFAGALLKLARKWKADPEGFDWSQIGKDPNQLELPI